MSCENGAAESPCTPIAWFLRVGWVCRPARGLWSSVQRTPNLVLKPSVAALSPVGLLTSLSRTEHSDAECSPQFYALLFGLLASVTGS